MRCGRIRRRGQSQAMSNDLSRDLERYAALSLVLLLAVGCYLVVRPFVTAFLWGGIIVVSTQGIYERVVRISGGRRRLAAMLLGAALAAVLLVPTAALGLHLAGRLPALSERAANLLSSGVSQPPQWVSEFPLVGKSVAARWQSMAGNPEQTREALRPLIKPVREFLVDFSASVGKGVLEFAMALLIAGLLYVWGEDLGQGLNRVARHLGGEVARKQVAVVESTVRGVFKGVIGTCAAQAILAAIGFWLAGVPRPVLLGVATFFLSVVPGGPAILWLPAAIWLYANGSAGWAIFLVLWGVLAVGSGDHLLRPLLIGRGVEAPFVVILLGVIGGVLAFGFLGIFIGPTLLSVAHNLLRGWMASLEA